MRQIFKTSLAAVLILVLVGCSHTLFVGELATPDAYGVDRQTRIYWSKTDPVGARAKAGPIVMHTACGTPIAFVQRPDGRIVFLGEPDRDRVIITGNPADEAMTCGRVDTSGDLVDLAAGELRVYLWCEPVADDFALVPRNYPGASAEPYLFPVTAQQRWSLSGDPPAAPEPLNCPD